MSPGDPGDLDDTPSDGRDDAEGRGRLTRRSSDRARVGALAAAGILMAFLQTVITPIYPTLAEHLDASPADISWVFTSTLLAAAVSTPISARLGDMYGKRRVLLALLVIVAVGNALAAVSGTLPLLIVARVLQGTGLGVIALGVSIMRDIIAPHSLGAAVALMSATLGAGGAVGLPIAALVADLFEWHALFWLALALTVAVAIAVVLVIPVSTLRAGGTFDLPGAIGAAAVLVAVLLGVSKAEEWGWAALGVALGSLPVLAWWVRRQLRIRDPFVDLRVAGRRTVLFTNLSSVGVGFSFFVVTGTLPILLEAGIDPGPGFGLELLPASLCLMPLGLVMFLVSPIAGRIARRRGALFNLRVGVAIVAVGFGFASTGLDELWRLVAVSTISGVGVGFAYGAMPTLIMSAVPSSETAASNGLNSVMRTVGSAVSSSVVALILTQNTIGQTPTALGYSIAFLVGAAVAVASLLAAFLIRPVPPAAG